MDALEMEKLYLENERFIIHVAKKYKHQIDSWEDCLQIARLGFLKGLKKYDPSKGKLTSITGLYITSELNHFIMSGRGTFKTSRWLYEDRIKIHRALSSYEFEKELLTREEVAKLTGLSLKRVNAVYEVDSEIKDLDMKFGKEDSLTFKETIADTEVQEISFEMMEVLNQYLTEKEKDIIMLRYVYNWTQGEVGKKYGLTAMSIGNLERKIKEKLRKNIKR